MLFSLKFFIRLLLGEWRCKLVCFSLQIGTTATHSIAPNSKSPLYWTSKDAPQNIAVRMQDWGWSQFFPIERDKHALRLPGNKNDYYYLHAAVKQHKSGFVVMFYSLSDENPVVQSQASINSIFSSDSLV